MTMQAFARYIPRPYGRRVGYSDAESLALVLGLSEETDTIAAAVESLRVSATHGPKWLQARHSYHAAQQRGPLT
jgi:hypothetical protein